VILLNQFQLEINSLRFTISLKLAHGELNQAIDLNLKKYKYGFKKNSTENRKREMPHS